jgi:hypothetical protein
MMNEIYTIRGITLTRDPDYDCSLILYSISDGAGWLEYETAIYAEDITNLWTPATMEHTNHLYKLLNNDCDRFDDIMREICGGASTELYIKQN